MYLLLLIPYLICSVFLNDLYFFDIEQMEWRQIVRSDVLGEFPSPRRSMGMAAINDKIIFYGGTGAEGT
jgi:hypothetical protein